MISESRPNYHISYSSNKRKPSKNVPKTEHHNHHSSHKRNKHRYTTAKPQTIANFVDMTTPYPLNYPIPAFDTNLLQFRPPAPISNYTFQPFVASDSYQHLNFLNPKNNFAFIRSTSSPKINPNLKNNSNYQVYEDVSQVQALPLLSLPKFVPVVDKPPFPRELGDNPIRNHRPVYTILSPNTYGKKMETLNKTVKGNLRF